jgi:hypothetical protein
MSESVFEIKLMVRLDLMFKKKISARKFRQYNITDADRMEIEQDAEVI